MQTNPFTSSAPMISASILSANFATLGAEIHQVLDAGCDFLHLDVMDGHFVPNISFGPAIIKSIRPVTAAYFDAHLMISEPLRYAPAMVKAGAQNITFHIEAVDDAVKTAREIRKLGCHVGITLNPATSVEKILPVLAEVDLVLVMSVVPGFSGQKFMPEVLQKAAVIKKRLAAHQRLEMDGGINLESIEQARDSGVDWFVVASAIFDQQDRVSAISALRAKL